MKKAATKLLLICLLGLGLIVPNTPVDARASIDHPIVKLRSLDKITARTMIFEANVGSTVKFGSVYIKVQACRKAPEMEQPESAAFLQIWEVNENEDVPEKEKSKWVFSGWMFASSPGLSSMDHPVYDVWVLDCLNAKGGEDESDDAQAMEGEGELEAGEVPAEPAIAQ